MSSSTGIMILLRDGWSKGLNLLSAVLTTNELLLPIEAKLITQTHGQPDGKVHRHSEVSKNELLRALIQVCWQNASFDYVATTSWFRGMENMTFITHRDFFMAIKCNRLAALRKAEKKAGRWTNLLIPPFT